MSGELQLTELLIDGKQVTAADGRTFNVLDPFTHLNRNVNYSLFSQ